MALPKGNSYHSIKLISSVSPHSFMYNLLFSLMLFPLSQSLPSGSFQRPLILPHQRADREKTTITGN